MRKRIDANQNEIVATLRKIGCSVFITSMVGHGFPDIVCGHGGKNYLFEIKDGDKSKSCRKLTNLENLFHLSWQGSAHIITCTQDAIDIISKF
ncbi:MAG TPA: hypothetical protein VNX68_02240 [Nitrosopumilaceae archaeon]|jgi:Holliday junction resolvase|nr:hypothetical protein [Nitrosopumilaceae archaeon]